jgi:tetratricopeptide (TPR) repeat protein
LMPALSARDAKYPPPSEYKMDGDAECQSDSTANTWSEALQRAVNMSRRAEYREAVRKFRELLSWHPIDSNVELHAYVLSQMADAEIPLGEYHEAETVTKEALGSLTSAGKVHSGTFAITEGVLADALRAQGNYREAKRVAEHALAVGEDTFKNSQPRIGILLTTLSQILEESGELSRAEKLCGRALAIFKAGDEGDVSLGNAYQNLAVVYVKERKFKQALEAVTSALASWNRAFPANHPFTVYALNTKIAILKELRAFQEAEQIIPEALKLALILYGPDNPERMFALNNSAGVYLAEKKYVQAEALLHEAIDIGRCRFTAGHPLLNNVLRNYAYALEKLNRKDEAARIRAESQVLLAFPDRSSFYFMR